MTVMDDKTADQIHDEICKGIADSEGRLVRLAKEQSDAFQSREPQAYELASAELWMECGKRAGLIAAWEIVTGLEYPSADED